MSQGRAILYLEDHPDTQKATVGLLTACGYEVHAVGTIREAREALVKRPFDLLLSDLELPDGTGWKLMVTLPRAAMIPAIALSSRHEDSDILLSRIVGFFAHLVKPVSPPELLKTIDNCLKPKVPLDHAA